jgi:nucleoside-diphosphate-sugar epimerase
MNQQDRGVGDPSVARRRILITGASGKLGSSLARLLSPHHEIVRLDVREPSNAEEGAIGRIHVGSVTDRSLVSQAFEGVDTVVHCAAIAWNRAPFDRLLNINIGGTVNLLEEAGARSKVERFVFVSTIRVHGVLETLEERFMPRFLPFDETHPYLTEEYYGGSKLHAEHWCRMYVKRFGKPVVVLRPSWICELHREPGFTAQPAPEHPDLLQYVFTSDLVDAVQRAMDHDPRGGFDCFLCHADEQRSTVPTLDFVMRHFPAAKLDTERLGAGEGFAPLVDCTHAKDRLGWKPLSRCKR